MLEQLRPLALPFATNEWAAAAPLLLGDNVDEVRGLRDGVMFGERHLSLDVSSASASAPPLPQGSPVVRTPPPLGSPMPLTPPASFPLPPESPAPPASSQRGRSTRRPAASRASSSLVPPMIRRSLSDIGSGAGSGTLSAPVLVASRSEESASGSRMPPNTAVVFFLCSDGSRV
jgi:hypothetical protein